MNTRTCVIVLLLASAATTSRAQSAPDDFWTHWFDRSDHSKSEQPHWVTPLATTTPRLEQEVRYDLVWQRRPDGSTLENYGNGKGLELIPAEKVEVILGIPAYLVHAQAPAQNGFADWRMLVKYRLRSHNEESGSDIVTVFLDLSAPTGSSANGSPKAILTPTIAYGKGLGVLDIQGTFGAGLPIGDVEVIGRTYVWNNALQCHLFRRLWPEVEINVTWYQQGKNDGQQQTLVTPGLVVGRIPLTNRVGLTIGAGIQFAVSRFRTTTHNAILSVRLPF